MAWPHEQTTQPPSHSRPGPTTPFTTGGERHPIALPPRARSHPTQRVPFLADCALRPQCTRPPLPTAALPPRPQPLYYKAGVLIYKFLSALPWELFEALMGLGLCFFGGGYCASIAAVEAFRMTGWATTKVHRKGAPTPGQLADPLALTTWGRPTLGQAALADVHEELLAVADASEQDDKKDGTPLRRSSLGPSPDPAAHAAGPRVSAQTTATAWRTSSSSTATRSCSARSAWRRARSRTPRSS